MQKGGVKAKAIMQVDWSQGGDAIVADRSIRRVEDLKGKKISLVTLTPSHWLLEYSLQNSSLSETDQKQISTSLVGKATTMDARSDFVAGKVDATVVWEPDVSEALKNRPGAHKLVSTETAANLIADLMVAQESFINEHPDVIRAFVAGWFDGTQEANRKPDQVVKLLMENEALYKELGEDATRASLPTVKWADLADNAKMFGLDGSEPMFDRIFRDASTAWVRRGIISQAVSPASAKDDQFVRELYGAIPKEVRVKAPEAKFPARPPREKQTQRGIMTKPVNIFFASGSTTLDPNGKQVLDQVATVAQTFSNAYIRVEGNTDSRGNTQQNIALSRQRAQGVVKYLTTRYRLNPSRFIAVGNGPNKPVASNATEGGRSRNRRTDVTVVPR
jgi:NitT/TauT family transport system substrate-binding protein